MWLWSQKYGPKMQNLVTSLRWGLQTAKFQPGEVSTPSTVRPDEGGILIGIPEGWEPQDKEETGKYRRKKGRVNGQWVTRKQIVERLPFLPSARTESLLQGNDFPSRVYSLLLHLLWTAILMKAVPCSDHHHKPQGQHWAPHTAGKKSVVWRNGKICCCE